MKPCKGCGFFWHRMPNTDIQIMENGVPSLPGDPE
jgi:hypothetical protein